MMTKEEHIGYWNKSAEDDWQVVQTLFSSGNYVQCLFFTHLVLEKICKAHWVKENENNTPPRTHNLVVLVRQGKLELPESDLLFLEEFNDFQLEGRYPDYKFEIHKRCTQDYSNQLLNRAETIKKWLQDKL